MMRKTVFGFAMNIPESYQVGIPVKMTVEEELAALDGSYRGRRPRAKPRSTRLREASRKYSSHQII